MKKLLLSAALVGALMSGPVLAQNAEQNQNSKAPSATTQTDTKVAPSGERARVSGSVRTQERGERHRMHDGDRGRRTTVGVRVSGHRDSYRQRVSYRYRDSYRYRHHHGYAAYGYGCRKITIKTRYHGHVVIKRIKRCG